MAPFERPSSWPVVPAGGPNLWPILDTRAVLASTAAPALPDSTWVPLMAAVLAFHDLGRKERSQLLADLGRHAPEIAAASAWKKVPVAKGCAEAGAAGLDAGLLRRHAARHATSGASGGRQAPR